VASISVEATKTEGIELAEIRGVADTTMTQTSRDSEANNEDRASGGIPMKEDKKVEDFVVSVGLTSAQAANQLAKFGRNELPEKVIPKVRGYWFAHRPPLP
jgi:hypothetical protein